MRVADVRFLESADGRRLLDLARASRGRPLHQRIRELERAGGADAARQVSTQDALRVRAAAKTPHAEALLFEREALEQATAWPVAVERASRWPGPPEVPLVDLGAGLGFDALVAADAGRPVVAVEHEPARAALLAANARALGLDGLIEVRCQDLGAASLAGALAFLDPDRRATGARTRDASTFSPPAAAWRDLLAAAHAALVKAPPSLEGDDVPDVPFEVVSLDREARERRLFFGAWPTLPARRALCLPSGASVEGAGAPWPAPRQPAVGDRLLDPDAAVRHAGLVGDLALREALRPVHADVGYLLAPPGAPRSPQAQPGTWLTIEAVLPLQVRALNAWLRAEGIGDLTLRKRGIDAKVATWRKKLRPRGPHRGTLVLTKGPDDRWLALGCRGD